MAKYFLPYYFKKDKLYTIKVIQISLSNFCFDVSVHVDDWSLYLYATLDVSLLLHCVVYCSKETNDFFELQFTPAMHV